MKHIILSVALIVGLLSVSVAQNVEAYILQLPDFYLSTGGKIYVEPLVNKGSKISNLSSEFVSQTTGVLENAKQGAVSGAANYNSWLTTKFYDIVTTADEADYIIKGDYLGMDSQSDTITELSLAETKEGIKYPIPFTVAKYSASSFAAITGTVTVVNAKTNAVVKTVPIDERSSNSVSAYFGKPDIESSSASLTRLAKSAKSGFVGLMAPRYTVFDYDFKVVKSKDKVLKKEFKSYKQALKSFADAGQIDEMAKIYFDMQAKEDNETVRENLAKCYEIKGNYTKAKELFVNAGSRSDIDRILQQIQKRDLLQGMGIEVVEYEFQ